MVIFCRFPQNLIDGKLILVYRVKNVRQIYIHTDEPLVSPPTSFEVETAIENVYTASP